MKPPHHHEPPLLFDWDRRERTLSWLLLYVLFTALGFAALFILFRIVTPEAPRLTSRPQQMIVLNPDVPAERSLINRAMDLSFTLLPSESSDQRDVPAALKTPDFRSTTSSFELKLKAPNAGPTAHERPRLLAHEIDVLPPLPPVTAQPVKAAPISALRVKIDGALADRLISGSTLRDIPLSDPSRPRFHVAVGPLGQVMMALPLTASDDPAVMVRLHAAMTQLRFKPAGKDIEWAQVGFHWEREPAP